MSERDEMKSAIDWSQVRAEAPVTERWAYFDHAAVCPLIRPVQQAIAAWADAMSRDGVACWPEWRKEVEAVRTLGARLLNADEEEVAVVRNTTEGINLVAEGYPWEAGDNVVAPASEFPSNRFAWMNLKSRGVEARIVPVEDERLDLKRVEDACDEKTRVVAVSWVGYATGWRNDLEALAEMAHRRGALLFVDAIQGLGALPLDAAQGGIDCLAADGHKWLLGPEGAGLFWVRREHLNRLRPVGVGWNSAQHPGDFLRGEFVPKRTAARYEGGTYPMPGIAGLAASLRWLLDDIGLEAVQSRLIDVTERLCEELQQAGAEIASARSPERRSGIVAFELPGVDPRRVQKACRDAGVIVNCRAGRVRTSPHVTTNDEDIARLAAVVRGLR